MIDKLDVRIPDFTGFGPLLRGPMDELRRRPIPHFCPSQRYQHVCDLRKPYDVDAVVHLGFRHGRHNHKVEIIDAGEKTLEEMAGIITQLFDVDPWSMQVMRTDLAADIEGVPVPWFKDNAYISRKQFSSRISKSFEQELQFILMGSGDAQTIYAGKRPNFFRIYDKLAEWRIHFRRIERQYLSFNKRMEGLEMTDEQRYFGQLCPPTFQEFCRRYMYDFQPGKILTRVERQIGGKIPSEYATVGDLRYAHELDPFTALQILPSAEGLILDAPPPGVSVRNWLAAIGFEQVKKHLGSAQVARQMVLKNGKNNGRRILESLAESVPSRMSAISLVEIRESFRASTLIQTSQTGPSGIHLSPTYEQTREIA